MTNTEVVKLINDRLEIYLEMYEECGNDLDKHTAKAIAYGASMALRGIKNKLKEEL